MLAIHTGQGILNHGDHSKQTIYLMGYILNISPIGYYHRIYLIGYDTCSNEESP